MTTATTPIEKKTKPTKASAPKKSPKKKEKQKAAAFLNWAVIKKDGSLFKGGRGLPIFQNPEYPNAKEDALIALAEQNGGEIELTMKVIVRLNKEAEPVNLADFL